MKIGLLGGGQLSKMLALAGIPLGMTFDFYFPNQEHSLNQLGTIHNYNYNDYSALEKFAEQVDVITYENENIPIATLEYLSKLKKVFPDKKALQVSHDRLHEKNMFFELGIPTNRYFEVNNMKELLIAIDGLGYPLMLKKRTQGYDGRGQIKINHSDDLIKITNEDCCNVIAEEFIDFAREVSLIGARNSRSQVVFYDICENVHRDGILFKTVNCTNDLIFELAKTHLEKIMTAINYVGVLTLEFFQVKNKLIANEMAPRVHNSGHWTIDACITSQFENHLRSILNLPLGNSTSLSVAHMYNILSAMPNKNKLLSFNNLRLYDYQKTPRLGRKLGHITLLNQDNNDPIELEKILSGIPSEKNKKSR